MFQMLLQVIGFSRTFFYNVLKVLYFYFSAFFERVIIIIHSLIQNAATKIIILKTDFKLISQTVENIFNVLRTNGLNH